jgi:hypothetical protein
MNLIILTLVAVSALSTFPVRTLCTTTVPLQELSDAPTAKSEVTTAANSRTTQAQLEPEIFEEPKTLPLQEASNNIDNKKKVVQNVQEIWQETEREVLIRSERGAKDQNGGTTSGKKGNKKENKKDKSKLTEQQRQAQQQLQQLQESHKSHPNPSQKNPKNNTLSHQKHHQKQNKTDKKNPNANKKEKQVDESKFLMPRTFRINFGLLIRFDNKFKIINY